MVESMTMSVPSVFEADLPTVEYEEASSPDEAHRNLRKALEQAPIAMGPHGPEILSYDLVRATLRDRGSRSPQGLGLETQGITSGPLWQRATHQPAGDEWRRPHPAAPTRCRRRSRRGRSRGSTTSSSTSSTS